MQEPKPIQKEWDPQTKIYLLAMPVAPKMIKYVGFKALGSGEEFTFAFTSVEKLKAFVAFQKQAGMLGNIGKEFNAVWMTLDEYFAKPGNNELYIDPPDDFAADFGLPNPN